MFHTEINGKETLKEWKRNGNGTGWERNWNGTGTGTELERERYGNERITVKFVLFLNFEAITSL